MPTREFTLENGQTISIVKSRRSKHMRISISPNGRARVSIPSWLPYRQGLEFARQKQDWILANNLSTHILESGHIGKSHQLSFIQTEGTEIKTRVSGNDIIIKVPHQAQFDDKAVQEKARKACIRALKTEANTLLPIRLQQLANKHSFDYKSLKIKHLNGRWGSCSSAKDITLNCLLMQLSWAEIDYVILHELVHTTNMSHDKEFWSKLDSLIGNMRAIKQQIKERRPILESL